MAIVNQHIQSNTFSTALTVPAGKTYAITNILVCNNGDAGSANFDMHFVPQGDPISNTDTRVINNLTLPFGETFTFDNEKIVLDTGDSLRFNADPTVVFPNAAVSLIAVGKTYEIVTTGTTDFTTMSAADSNPGTIFTATSTGTGTGTVKLYGYSNLSVTVSYLEV